MVAMTSYSGSTCCDVFAGLSCRVRDDARFRLVFDRDGLEGGGEAQLKMGTVFNETEMKETRSNHFLLRS